MKELKIGDSAQKELDRMDKPTRKRIVKGLAGLLNAPPQGDIKPLKGALKGISRLRVGNWRIAYEVTAKSVDILAITPRGGAY